MVDQISRATGREPPDDGIDDLLRELCRHVEERFPGRIDLSTMLLLVRRVLINWRNGPLRHVADDLPRGLKADTNRAVLAWLRENGKVPAGSQEYDDFFVETVFNGGFDASAIRRGMGTLIRDGRVIEFLIVTHYLDMAEIDGSPPHPSDVVDRLSGPGRSLSRQFVREAVLEFYQLLCRQAVA